MPAAVAIFLLAVVLAAPILLVLRAARRGA